MNIFFCYRMGIFRFFEFTKNKMFSLPDVSAIHLHSIIHDFTFEKMKMRNLVNSNPQDVACRLSGRK